MVPPNHPFVHRIFHEINHPFWGTPIFGNIHIYPVELDPLAVEDHSEAPDRLAAHFPRNKRPAGLLRSGCFFGRYVFYFWWFQFFFRTSIRGNDPT